MTDDRGSEVKTGGSESPGAVRDRNERELRRLLAERKASLRLSGAEWWAVDPTGEHRPAGDLWIEDYFSFIRALGYIEPGLRVGLQVSPDKGGSRWMVTGLHISATAEAPEIGGRDLRRLPLTGWLATVRAMMLLRVERFPDARWEWAYPAPPGEAKVRRGPKGYSAEFYRAVAETYLRLTAEGRTSGLHDAIAEEMRPWLADGDKRPASTVKTWIRRAAGEPYNFLSGMQRGRIGADPGPGLADRRREV